MLKKIITFYTNHICHRMTEKQMNDHMEAIFNRGYQDHVFAYDLRNEQPDFAPSSLNLRTKVHKIANRSEDDQ